MQENNPFADIPVVSSGSDPFADIPVKKPITPQREVYYGTQDQIVQKAASAKGTKYKWSGNDMKYGIDCSGLTCQTYGSVGIKTPRTAAEQYQAFQSVPEGQMLKGDAVFFYGDRKSGKQLANGKYITHVGIYDGNGNIIHASSRNGKVVQEPLAKLKKNVAGYGRPRELHDRYQKEMAIGGQPNTPYIDGLRNPLVESINKALADKPQPQAPTTPYTPPPTFKDIAAKALLEKREGNALIARQKAQREAEEKLARQTSIGPVENPEYVKALREKAKGMGLSGDGPEDIYIANEIDKLDEGELLNLWIGGNDIPESFQRIARRSREFEVARREALNKLSTNIGNRATLGAPLINEVAGYVLTLPLQAVSELGTYADENGYFTGTEKMGALANIAVELATAGSASGAKAVMSGGKKTLIKAIDKVAPNFRKNVSDILAGKKINELDTLDLPAAKNARAQVSAREQAQYTADVASREWRVVTRDKIKEIEQAVVKGAATPEDQTLLKQLKGSLKAGKPHKSIPVEETPRVDVPLSEPELAQARIEGKITEPGATGAVEETPLQNVGSTPTASTSVKAEADPLMSAKGEAPTEQAQMGKSPVVENEPAIFTQLKAAMERTKIDPKIQKAALIQLDTLIQTGKKAGKDLNQIVWKALDRIDPSGKLKSEYSNAIVDVKTGKTTIKIPDGEGGKIDAEFDEINMTGGAGGTATIHIGENGIPSVTSWRSGPGVQPGKGTGLVRSVISKLQDMGHREFVVNNPSAQAQGALLKLEADGVISRHPTAPQMRGVSDAQYPTRWVVNDAPLASKEKAKGVMGAYTRVKRSIELVEDKATLETFFHEMGHYTHEVLQDHAEYGKVIRQHYGDIMDRANTAGAERFANAFVNYIRKGEAPTSKLAEVFEAVAGFIRKLIGKKKLDEFPEEVRDIFDKIYSQELSPHAQRLLDEFEEITRGLPANKNTSAARSAAGLTPDARLKSTTTKQIFDDADKLYKKYEEGGYETPEVQSALDGWRKHRRPLDAKNEVLISRVLDDLETKSNELAKEISTLSKPGDAELRTLKGKEWEKIAAQIDETSRVLQESGSWLGRALGIRSQLKRVLNKDANLAASAHHPGVTDKVREAYKASVEQAEKAEKALRDAIRKSINSYVDEGSDALDPLFQLDANEIDDLLRLPDPKPNSRGEIELHDYVDQAVFRSLKNGATDTKAIIDDVINELGGELGLDIDQVKRAIKESLVYFDSKARRGVELGDAVYAPRGGAPKSAGVESEAIKELRDNLNMIREELGYRKGEKLVAGRVSVGELRSELEILFKELNATHDLEKMRELRVKVGELRRKVVAGRVDANDFMARATDADIAKLKADFKRATDEAEAAIKHLTPQGWWDAIANHFNIGPLMSIGNRVMDAQGYVYNAAETAPGVIPFQAVINAVNRLSGGKVGWAGSLSTPPAHLMRKAFANGFKGGLKEIAATWSSKFGRPKLKKVYDQGFVYEKRRGLQAVQALHNAGLAGVSIVDAGPSMMKYHQALMQTSWLRALEEVDTMALGNRKQWIEDRTMRLYLDAPHDLTEEAMRLVDDWRFSAPAFGGELMNDVGFSGRLDLDFTKASVKAKEPYRGPLRAAGALANLATVRFANIFVNLKKPGLRMAHPVLAWAEVAGKYVIHGVQNVRAGKGVKSFTPTEVFGRMSPSQRRMFVNAVGRAGAVTVASMYLPQFLYHSLGARPVSYDPDRKEWEWGLHGIWNDIPGLDGLAYKLNMIHNQQLYLGNGKPDAKGKYHGAYGEVGSPGAIERRDDAHRAFAYKYMMNHPLVSGASRAFRAFQSEEGALSVAGTTLRRAVVPAAVDVFMQNSVEVKDGKWDKFLTAMLLKAPYRKSLNTGLGKNNRFTDELIGVYFKPGTYDTRHPLPWMDKPPTFSHPVIKELTRIGFRLDVQRATGESDEEFKIRRAMVTEALWNDPEFGVQVLINDPKWKELDDIAKREKVMDFRSKLVSKMNAEVENAWQNKEFLKRYREKFGKEPPMAEQRQNK